MLPSTTPSEGKVFALCCLVLAYIPRAKFLIRTTGTRTAKKVWDAISHSFSLSADLNILRSMPFIHLVKFYSFMFLHQISTRAVCANGKHSSVG